MYLLNKYIKCHGWWERSWTSILYTGYMVATVEQFQIADRNSLIYGHFSSDTLCVLFAVVQFRSCAELVSVTDVLTTMSAGKCKLSNIYLWWHWVTKLVEALNYKLGGHGFESPQCHSNFFIDIILPATLWAWHRLSL